MERAASRVHADPDAIDAVLRRVDRRRRNRRLTAGGIALVVAVAGAVVAATLVGGRTNIGPGAPPFASLWPQSSEAEARIAQARANQGDHGLTWEQDANEFLYRFANDGLRWVRTTIPQIGQGDAAGNGPLTASLRGAPAAGCTSPDTAPDWVCPAEAFRTAEVTIERLVQRDAQGIWSVTAATVEGQPQDLPPSPLPAVQTDTPPPTPELPEEVRSFVGGFMDSRLAGTDDARNHLGTAAATAYHSGAGGLELYGYTRQAGVTWRISGWNVEPDTDRWQVVVEIQGYGSSSIYETLRVGSPGDGRPLRVLDAERNE